LLKPFSKISDPLKNEAIIAAV